MRALIIALDLSVFPALPRSTGDGIVGEILAGNVFLNHQS